MATTDKYVANKIACVRTVVANYSNDEILLVLEHNDYDVDVTISDFLEGHANDILTQWQHTGSMKMNKTKKKKKVQKKKKNEQTTSTVQDRDSKELTSISSKANEDINQCSTLAARDDLNEIKSNDSKTVEVALKQLLVSEPTNHTASLDSQSSFLASQSPSGDEIIPRNSHVSSSSNINQSRNKTTDSNIKSAFQSESALKTKWSSKKQRRNNKNYKSNNHENRPFGQNSSYCNNDKTNSRSIEKALHDLQFCSSSFSRHRIRLNEEIDNSYKRIKQVFEDVTSALIDREVQLMRMLDVRKEDVLRLLNRREKRASELRRSTERASGMTEHQVDVLLRDVDDFLTDRKAEDDLNRSNQFVFDKKLLEKFIPNFGSISPTKTCASSLSTCDSTFSNASTATSSLLEPSLQDASCPNVSKSNFQPASDCSGSLLNNRANKEIPLLTEVEALAGTPNWADSVDVSHVNASGASWANDISPVTGCTENGSGSGSQEIQSDPPCNDSEDRPLRTNASRQPHLRSRENPTKCYLAERGDGMRNAPRPSFNGVSNDSRHSPFNNRFKGGYRRNDRGSDFHAIPPIPYHVPVHFNGYRSQPFYAPHAGPSRNRAHNYRPFDGSAPRRDFRARRNGSEQNTS